MISAYDFRYKGLMKNAMQSIPVGNGDIGANVWAVKNEICILLSKCDAFSRLHRLLKTGFIRLRFPDGVLNKKTLFHLSLEEGILRIENKNINCEIYADAHAPVYKINLSGKYADKVRLDVINYRDKPEKLGERDLSNYQLNCERGKDIDFDCTEDSDTLFTVDNMICQYHENGKSLYEFSLEHQHLSDYPNKNDFLTGLTFGFIIKSDDMHVDGDSLCVNSGAKKVSVEIYSPIAKNKDEFLEKIKNFPETDLDAHKNYWKNEWAKSFVYISGGKKAKKITEAYIYQRYMHLLSGRGKYPIKFNGSIFTCQPSPFNKDNMDYRDWGGYYWLQNTRLIYWAMLFSGDYDLMTPFFKLYTDNLDFCKYRTQKYFGHGGAHYPETLSLFGAYADNNYGWKRDGLADGITENTYIRYYWCGALEVALMMMMYCKNSGDTDFEAECLEYVKQTVLFFYEHFKTENGKMYLKPTSSLETWHSCINDSPTIAGVISVCTYAVKFFDLQPDEAAFFNTVKNALPPIPHREIKGKQTISPYEELVEKKKMNMENPELYPVFPYGLYRFGYDNNEIGINTFNARTERASYGWQQNAIHAAFLGLSKEAYKEICKKASNKNKNCIFPAFFGPNYDYLPDQCNGSGLNMAVAASLVQYNEDEVFILPAWNKKLNVKFRLPVGDNFINAEYTRGGKIIYSFEKEEKRKVIT